MIDHLSLADHQLEDFARSLEGAETFPGPIKVAQVLGERLAISVNAGLERMATSGWSPGQLRILLLSVLAERTSARRSWDWVVSGPALEGVPTRDTGVVYRSLVEQARERLLLSSYALYNGRELFAPLHDALLENPALRVRLILDVSRDFHDHSVSDGIVARFKERFRKRDWPWVELPEVYFDPRGLELDPARKAVLHAKCVIVDGKSALVTSANLTRAAQEKNIEAGVLVQDASRVAGLERFFEGLIESGVLKRLDFHCE